MKRLLLICLSILSVFLFVACNGDDNEKQIIELSYADWGDQEFNQKMIDAFEKKYPHIKVTLRTDIAGSGEAFTANLINVAQAGLLPDVFATDNVPTVVRAGSPRCLGILGQGRGCETGLSEHRDDRRLQQQTLCRPLLPPL